MLFDAMKQNEAIDDVLPAVDIDALDYACWKKGQLSAGFFDAQINWWRDELRGLHLQNLPLDKKRPVQFDYQGSSLEFILNPELSTKIRVLAAQEQTTVYALMLSAFEVLLSHYSGQHDVAVGTQLAERNHSQLKSVVGFLVQTVVVRQQIDLKTQLA